MKKSPLKSARSRPALKTQIQKESLSFEELLDIAEDKILSGFKNRVRTTIPQEGTGRAFQRVFKDDQDFYENATPEMARAGVQVGDRFYLAFRAEDLDIEKGHSNEKGPKIPFLRVNIHSQAIVEIFGSHLKGDKDKAVTHLIHNKSQFDLISIEGE
jgi:hypothetical protein